MLFANTLGHSADTTRAAVTLVCAFAFAVAMYWQYDTLGSIFIVGLSAALLAPLLLCIDYGSGLQCAC